MNDNRTTELLCMMLDERGLSCQTHYLHASWCVGPKLYEAVDNLDGTLTVSGLTPEQAIAATLGSNQEANLGDALNEVAEKWAEVQVSAEEYAKRCRMLESLARDMFAYIDNCCESDLSFGCVDPVDCAYYDKARDCCTKAPSLKQRMKALGLEVD